MATVPVSLSVDASSNDWQSYSGGTYDHPCKCNTDGCLDHGVGGVGYGTDAAGGDIWYVKNSWGADWGDKGYIMLQRGLATLGKGGACGVMIDNQVITGKAL